jgi:hypothetical protein
VKAGPVTFGLNTVRVFFVNSEPDASNFAMLSFVSPGVAPVSPPPI